MDSDCLNDMDSLGDMEVITENEGHILDNAIDDTIEANCEECLECSNYSNCIRDKSFGCNCADGSEA